MLYAKVVIGLKVEGPFDYIVPEPLRKQIKTGSRVLVSFGFRTGVVGFVVGVSAKTRIKKLKPLLEVLDDQPLVSRRLLDLAGEIADYYCCSLGEAIEAALPDGLRKAKRISSPLADARELSAQTAPAAPLLIHEISGSERWDIYRKEIEESLKNRASAIILLPDVQAVLKAKETLAGYFAGYGVEILYRKQPRELETWLKVQQGKAKIVVGTRSAVFAPVVNLGLIIIEEEQDFGYKQDQSPHYHAREVAFMRCRLEKARLILGSSSPSLESFYLAKEGRLQCLNIARKKNFPEVMISDMRNMPLFERRKQPLFSRYMLDCVIAALKAKGKTLLFMNRKGFATAAFCMSCGRLLKCARCNSNLVYHYQDKALHCPYCAFTREPPRICPECNSGYIKYSGTGTEKVESEIARLIPQAQIKLPQEHSPIALNEADIFIASEGTLRGLQANFDLIGVLSIDNLLNRIDFRAGEKVFILLSELWRLSDKKIIIQTRLPRHYCFRALQEKNTEVFYQEELKQRKQLRLPPFSHIALVKLRGAKEEKVKNAGTELFASLRAHKKNGVRVISLNPGQPSRLRGNYYWQIALRCADARKMSRYLKSELNNFKHSGIIVTVDVDPI